MLFVALARAAGIPSREAGGYMYMGDKLKAFGGHAWCEVVLDGHWVEDGSGTRCATQREGSFHWGRIRYEFSADWSTFQGGWSYCEEAPGSGNWTGTRK